MLCGASYLQRAHANKHVAAAHPERDPASSSGHERIIRKLSDAEARRARDLGEDTSGLRRHRRTSPSMTSTRETSASPPATPDSAQDTARPLPVASIACAWARACGSGPLAGLLPSIAPADDGGQNRALLPVPLTPGLAEGSRSPTTAAGAADTLPVATLRTPKDEALANLGARLTPGQLPSAVVFGHSAAGCVPGLETRGAREPHTQGARLAHGFSLPAASQGQPSDLSGARSAWGEGPFKAQPHYHDQRAVMAFDGQPPGAAPALPAPPLGGSAFHASGAPAWPGTAAQAMPASDRGFAGAWAAPRELTHLPFDAGQPRPQQFWVPSEPVSLPMPHLLPSDMPMGFVAGGAAAAMPQARAGSIEQLMRMEQMQRFHDQQEHQRRLQQHQQFLFRQEQQQFLHQEQMRQQREMHLAPVPVPLAPGGRSTPPPRFYLRPTHPDPELTASRHGWASARAPNLDCAAVGHGAWEQRLAVPPGASVSIVRPPDVSRPLSRSATASDSANASSDSRSSASDVVAAASAQAHASSRGMSMEPAVLLPSEPGPHSHGTHQAGPPEPRAAAVGGWHEPASALLSMPARPTTWSGARRIISPSLQGAPIPQAARPAGPPDGATRVPLPTSAPDIGPGAFAALSSEPAAGATAPQSSAGGPTTESSLSPASSVMHAAAEPPTWSSVVSHAAEPVKR